MQIEFYNIGNEKVVLIDGILFIKANPEQGQSEVLHTDLGTIGTETPKKRGRKKWTKNKLSGEIEGDNFPTKVDLIKQEINAGKSVKDIVRELDVTGPYVYQIKASMRKNGELTEKDPLADIGPAPEFKNPRVKKYECVKGHYFNSTLEKSEVICPDCGAKVFRQVV